MSVMYIRNEQTGEFEPVPSLVGPQGPPGTNDDGAGTVTSVNKVAPDTTGNVTLTAANVGARPDNWMPTAADVGALPSDGTAVNATSLNGKSADEYLTKDKVVNNFTTTEEGFVADARALKVLNEKSAVLHSGKIAITTDGIVVNLSDRTLNYAYLIVNLGSSGGGAQFYSIISTQGNSFVKCFTTWYGDAIVQFSIGSSTYTECTVSLKDLASYPDMNLSTIIGIKL